MARMEKSLTLVGDQDQLLYRFAGATPEINMGEGFEERYPNGLTFPLETNYRSTHAIVDAQLALIAHNYSDLGGPYAQRLMKTLVAREDAEQGDPVTFTMLPDVMLEAREIVANTHDVIANGYQHNDIFIAARTRAQLGYLEGPLMRAKIPFVNLAGGSFWALRHIADMVAYLRLAYNDADKIAFARVYGIASKWMTNPWRRSPQYGEYCNHRFLGKAFMEAVNGDYREAVQAVNSYRFLLQKSFQPGSEDLVGFVQEMQAELAAADDASQVLRFVWEHCYKQYLAAEGELGQQGDSAKEDDVATMLEIASEYSDIGEFLEFVADAIKRAEAVKDKDWSNYLAISTVHRLKGLERPVVFGMGMVEGQHTKSGEPRGLLPHTFSLIAPPIDGVLPTGGQSPVEDERCIAFVCVSRAKEVCRLFGCRKYRGADMGPSRFVNEMAL